MGILTAYADVGGFYAAMGINFLVVDYRGYGWSGGTPTVSAMMADSHAVFAFVKKWLKEKGFSGKQIVMGRSLGSACALELAAHHEAEIDGLVIESAWFRSMMRITTRFFIMAVRPTCLV